MQNVFFCSTVVQFTYCKQVFVFERKGFRAFRLFADMKLFRKQVCKSLCITVVVVADDVNAEVGRGDRPPVDDEAGEVADKRLLRSEVISRSPSFNMILTEVFEVTELLPPLVGNYDRPTYQLTDTRGKTEVKLPIMNRKYRRRSQWLREMS